MSRSRAIPIATSLSSGTTFLSATHITSLWASYGSIWRLSVRLSTSSSTDPPTFVILKVINPPPPHGDSPDEGHARKLISYSVESWFYNNLSRRLIQVYAGSGKPPKVAEVFQDVISPTPTITGMILALEDLSPSFPYNLAYIDSLSHARAVLRWLARFHTAFMHTSTDIPGIPPPQIARADVFGRYTGVWIQGSYWYLATRRSEHKDMIKSGEWGWLEPWAEVVDRKLWPRDGEGDLDPEAYLGRTIIHGDAKAANIVFSKPAPAPTPRKQNSITEEVNGDVDDEVEAALYDFQYVGHGLGAVDLVYFLGTSAGLYRTELVDWQRYYYDKVVAALRDRGVNGGVRGWTWEVFQRQFDWAVVDLCRFGAGWGGWGNWRWVVDRAKMVVDDWESEGEGKGE